MIEIDFKDCSNKSIRKSWKISLLAGVVVVAFWQVYNHDFVLLDDDLHLNQNPALESPTLSKVSTFWKAPYQGLYIPATYTVWAFQKVIAQKFEAAGASKVKSPRVYHLSNLLIHVLNVLLVFLIIDGLIVSEWASVAGALLFAIHPLQVEPVAWISGLKDLLSGFFALGSLLLFLVLARRTPRRKLNWFAVYVSATVLFLLSCLAKPSSLVLPIIAGLLAHILLRLPAKTCFCWLSPWLLLAIPVGVLTKLAQPNVWISFIAPWWTRPFIAGDALSFYFSKLLFPFFLAPDYGRSPQAALASHWIFISWLVPVGFWCLLTRKSPGWKVTLGVFIAGLLPVLGFVPFFFQAFSTVADRYVYLSVLGPSIGVAYLLTRLRDRRAVLISVFLLGFLGTLSFHQNQYWKDSVTLFRHNLRTNPNSILAHNNLGTLLEKEDNWVEAIYHYEEVKRVDPNSIAAYYNLGRAYAKLKRFKAAIPYFEKVVAIQPAIADAQFSLGILYAHLGDVKRAERHLRETLGLRPNMPLAHRQIGTLYRESGQFEKAVRHLNAAVTLDPRDAISHLELGRSLLAQKRPREAVSQLKEAQQLLPDSKEIRQVLKAANRAVTNSG